MLALSPSIKGIKLAYGTITLCVSMRLFVPPLQLLCQLSYFTKIAVSIASCIRSLCQCVYLCVSLHFNFRIS